MLELFVQRSDKCRPPFWKWWYPHRNRCGSLRWYLGSIYLYPMTIYHVYLATYFSITCVHSKYWSVYSVQITISPVHIDDPSNISTPIWIGYAVTPTHFVSTMSSQKVKGTFSHHSKMQPGYTYRNINMDHILKWCGRVPFAFWIRALCIK